MNRIFLPEIKCVYKDRSFFPLPRGSITYIKHVCIFLLYGKRMQEFLSVGSLESNVQYFSVKFRPGNFATVPQEQKCFLLEA